MSASFMFHTSAYIILLVVCLLLLLYQLRVREKQLVHLLFACFCGSIAIMSAQVLGANKFGIYSYLIGMGACLTCNGYWLLSRTLFRPNPAIGLKHIAAAGAVAVLVIGKEGINILNVLLPSASTLLIAMKSPVDELLILLSSTMLVLTFWEGCRGLSQADREEKSQRLLFLFAYGFALLLCVVISKTFVNAENSRAIEQFFNAIAALSIVVITQVVIYWRFDRQEKTCKENTSFSVEINLQGIQLSASDGQLCDEIRQALFEQKMYLKESLRVADLARKLNVPEYKISQLLRSYFNAKNFNQFINQLRVDNAKKLLSDPTKLHWSVLVIGMESGFASSGPFLRAFKSCLGCTPNEYRQTKLGKQAADLEIPLA